LTLATSLRTAARNLINTFGNTGSVYTFSAATKTDEDEGDVTVTDWKTAASVKVVDGGEAQEMLQQEVQGLESLGSDDKIVRDDAAVVANDRITINSVEYRVVDINPVRTQDTVVVQIIQVERVTSTSEW